MEHPTSHPADPPANHDQLKAELRGYLDSQRAAIEWKVDGLSERDLRWPMTPTGSNLIGIVKHLGCMEFGYFGDVFGRPPAEQIPWLSPAAEPNADLFATAEETSADIVAFYRRAQAHADRTIDALDLTAIGRVPWWRPGADVVTLHRILAHMIAETARHAGHLDILRETIDGQAGLRPEISNVPGTGADEDPFDWPAYLQRLRGLAESAGSVKADDGGSAV